MAVTREKKAEQLTELKEKMKKSQSVLFAHYIGLTVGEVTELRGKLKTGKSELKVAKKTLMQLAAKELALPELTDASIDGPVACIFSFEDPLSGAQTAFAFSKSHPQVELIGGYYDGKVLTKADALALAKMPTKQQLLGMFAAMLQSPLRTFMSQCTSPLGSFARSLSALAEKGGVKPA
jgi:large subunit ribosomal protein L10